MPVRKSNTTEALIDGEMEFYRELEDGTKTRPTTSLEIHGFKAKEYSPAEVEKMVRIPKNGTVINSLNVKVRKEPSYEADVVEVLRKGDKVVILGVFEDFYKISTSVNRNVYISSNYIKEG